MTPADKFRPTEGQADQPLQHGPLGRAYWTVDVEMPETNDAQSRNVVTADLVRAIDTSLRDIRAEGHEFGNEVNIHAKRSRTEQPSLLKFDPNADDAGGW